MSGVTPFFAEVQADGNDHRIVIGWRDGSTNQPMIFKVVGSGRAAVAGALLSQTAMEFAKGEKGREDQINAAINFLQMELAKEVLST